MKAFKPTNIRQTIGVGLATVLLLAASSPAHAVEHTFESYKAHTSECGLTIKTPQEHTDVHFKEIPQDIVDTWPTDGHMVQLSKICEYDLDKSTTYNPENPLVLELPHDATKYRPHIYFWQKQEQKWIELPTIMNRSTLVATSYIHLPYSIVGVFYEKVDSYEGIASWYRHPLTPRGSATNLFPTGTLLKVTNLDTGASTTATITSTWTQTDENRVVDLVSTVFDDIGNLGAGLMRVRIEKLF